MGYIAKAYVKIPRESVQNLIMEICKLDYKNSAYHPCDVFWFIEDGYFYSREYTTELEERGSIDCNAHTPNGTEEEAVKLFLELAQMRDDAGTDARWLICDCPHFDDMYNETFEREDIVDGRRYKQLDMDLFSNATPLNVAIGFKEGSIEL